MQINHIVARIEQLYVLGDANPIGSFFSTQFHECDGVTQNGDVRSNRNTSSIRNIWCIDDD